MKKVLIISILTILAVGFVYFVFNFFQTETVKAGSGDNVSSYAWSENIGWISFNNTSGGGSTNYGVNVDTSTGAFSGYAWSENIGWIKFGDPLKIATENYPNCPLSTCSTGSPNYSAKLDLATNKITGWARACAGTVNGDCVSATRTDGWDGWILLGPIMKGGIDYGVERDVCDLKGFAWGSDVVGWIKFNGSNYKVVTTFCESVNQPPSANNLQVVKGDYCNNPAHYFSWTYSDQDGDRQSQFRFQVDNNSGFTFPEVDRTFSGLNNPSPTTNNQSVTVAISPGTGQIGYNPNWPNPNYYWRVRVWDSQGGDSGWIYPPNSAVSPGVPFSTEKHHYPENVDSFSWFPQSPTVNENTQFTDNSTCYDDLSSGSSCNTNDSFWWTFLPDGNPVSSVQQNPLVKFLSTGAKSVTLRVTDSDGFICQTQKTVSSQLPLPEWIEISPF